MSVISNESDAALRVNKRLREAVLQILDEEGCEIHDMTVSDLTQKAEISRATFYNYYENMDCFRKDTVIHLVDALLKQMIKFLVDGKEALKDNCKEKNLVIDQLDRNLIVATNSFVTFELITSNIPAFHKGFVDNGYKEFFEKNYSEKSSADICFFLQGYTIFLFDAFSQKLDYKELLKGMNYIFELHDYLFR